MLQHLIAAPYAFDAVSSEALLGEYLHCLCLQNGGESKIEGENEIKVIALFVFSPSPSSEVKPSVFVA